ncbi:MAG: hypothetical protein JRI44_13615, partial [Deltaproteobacteria bacterium]|nr:hypothetical protein [Deltaproteobacteria bacterium]
MLQKISILKDEEEKEKLGSGFGGGWNLSSLIEKEKEKKQPKKVELKSIKIIPEGSIDTGTKAFAQGDVDLGKSLNKSMQQQNLINKFTTPPNKPTVGGIVGISEPLDLSKVSEPAKKVIQAIGGIQGFRITEPELYQQTIDISNKINQYSTTEQKIAKAHELLTGTPMEKTLKDISQQKGEPIQIIGLKDSTKPIPDKYKEALTLAIQAQRFSTAGQIMDFLQTSARNILIGNLAINAGKIAFQSVPEIWNKIKNKDIVKHYSRDQILKIWDKVERGIANKAEQELIKTIAKEDSVINAIKEGFDITKTVPRFGMATGKVYGGLPADEIAKAIIETGKVTADVVKGLDPVKVSQVTQQLLNTSPVLANEFLKAVE